MAKLDSLDIQILTELQEDCRIPLQDIAEKVNAPVSTVHYRLKRLEKEGVIERYSAKLSPEKLEMEFCAVIEIHVHRKPDHMEIGRRLADLPGVSAVYWCLGDVDYFVIARAKDRLALFKTLEDTMKIKGITGSNTHVVVKIIKDDPRLYMGNLPKLEFK